MSLYDSISCMALKSKVKLSSVQQFYKKKKVLSVLQISRFLFFETIGINIIIQKECIIGSVQASYLAIIRRQERDLVPQDFQILFVILWQNSVCVKFSHSWCIKDKPITFKPPDVGTCYECSMFLHHVGRFSVYVVSIIVPFVLFLLRSRVRHGCLINNMLCNLQ